MLGCEGGIRLDMDLPEWSSLDYMTMKLEARDGSK